MSKFVGAPIQPITGSLRDKGSLSEKGERRGEAGEGRPVSEFCSIISPGSPGDH